MKYNNFYIKCLIRALKEFKSYNSNINDVLLKYINNNDYFILAPHVMCGDFLQTTNILNKFQIRDFCVKLMTERFVGDLKKYIKCKSGDNVIINDELVKSKLESFSIFSLLYTKFRLGEPNREDYIKYFYYG